MKHLPKIHPALALLLLASACGQNPAAPSGSNTVAVPSSSPLRPQATVTTRVYVDWGQTQRSVSSEQYGVGLYGGVASSVSSQPTYKTNLSYFKPGLLRFHRAQMLNDSATDIGGWVDVAGKRWDETRINAVMNDFASLNSSAYGNYKPTMLVNIPTWPSWMKTVKYTFTDGWSVDLLDPSEYDNYAAFCARLVTILKNQGRSIKYFTPTNEKDGDYYVSFANRNLPDRLDDLITIYNKAAVAMKAADPSIQVGGLEFQRGDLVAQVRRFVRGAKANLDFVAYHFYANNEPFASAGSVYNRTQDAARHGLDIVNILSEEGSSAKVFNSEFNINYAAQQDFKMTLSEGAAYDALVWIGALDNGEPSTQAWNDRDGYYGKLNNDDGINSVRVGAHNMRLFNTYMVGDRVTSTSDNPAVVTMAVKTSSQKSIALINRSSTAQTVAVNFAPAWNPPGSLGRFVVAPAPAYYYTGTLNTADLSNGNLTLEPNSVTVLNVADSQSLTSSSVELPRSGWSASASVSNAAAPPSQAIDGNLSSRWSSGATQATGQWFQLDLGSSQTFDKIVLDGNGHATDYIRRFEIYATDDPSALGTPLPTGAGVGVNGSTFGSGGGRSRLPTEITFAPVTKRYLRIVQRGSDPTWWWSVNELRIYSHALGANLLANPSFQAEGATQTPSGWSTYSPGGAFDWADYTETNLSRDGTLHGTQWIRDTAYQIATYQIKTGLTNGLYTLRAWVRSSGGQSAAYLYAKNYGGSERTAAPVGTSGWSQVTIPNINVSNGSLEIGFWSNAGAGQYLMFDDAELFRQ